MKQLLTFLILVLTIITSCKRNNENQVQEESLKNDTVAKFPELHGKYLGQKPPGNIAEIFAPGIISKYDDEIYPVFSKEGDEFYFVHRINYQLFKTYRMEMKNNTWSEPEIAWFSPLIYNNTNPAFSKDGNELYFASNRPDCKNDSVADYNIFRLTKKDTGWSEPKLLEFNNPGINELSNTVASNGNIYFHAADTNNKDNPVASIYISEKRKNGYTKPKKLPEPVNGKEHNFYPFIATDESYIIFSSHREGGYGLADLYVCFRTPGGSWGKAINLGPTVNTDNYEYAPTVSPDGKYLFYTSTTDTLFEGAEYQNPQYLNFTGNIFWVSTNILDSLKNIL